VLKFQAVAEKTAKDARGLLYFTAPGIYLGRWRCRHSWIMRSQDACISIQASGGRECPLHCAGSATYQIF